MSRKLRQMTEAHLGELAEEIWRGRCIAFVGAGFSAAAQLPGWVELLRNALSLVPPTHDNYSAVERTLQNPEPSNRELEAAGQLLQDAIGVQRFREAISASLAVDESSLSARYVQRRRMLRELPFRAILTTNFDPLLPGSLPTAEGYRRLLRDSTGGLGTLATGRGGKAPGNAGPWRGGH